MRTRCLALALLVFLWRPAPVAAEWQIKPFVGLTFGGGTTFVDPEHAAGRANLVVGVTGALLGAVLGVDADFGRAPGFFQSGAQDLVLNSSVTTLTGNVVIALPRRLSEYTLRPYLVGGVGLIHAQIDGRLGALRVSSTLPAMDFGAGATGFLTDRVGLSWEVRRFQSFGGQGQVRGVSFGEEELSFWRANMAVALRY
jgi:hypothetical protein